MPAVGLSYRTETTADIKARAPPTIGKYNGINVTPNDPTNKASEAPKHTPGKTVGSMTPKASPTQAASSAKT
jgi:hypothetical protein